MLSCSDSRLFATLLFNNHSRREEEIVLVLHLCTEYSISLLHFLSCVEILIQQSSVVFLRMAAHIVHLPSVVGIGWRSVEIFSQPNPESSAGQKTHGKVQRLFIVHQISVEWKVLLHSWSLLNGRLTLWSIKYFQWFQKQLEIFKVFVFLFLPWKNIVWELSLQNFCSSSICLSWSPWCHWAELLWHSFSSTSWWLSVDSWCPGWWSWRIALPAGCRSPFVSGSPTW